MVTFICFKAPVLCNSFFMIYIFLYRFLLLSCQRSFIVFCYRLSFSNFPLFLFLSLFLSFLLLIHIIYTCLRVCCFYIIPPFFIFCLFFVLFFDTLLYFVLINTYIYIDIDIYVCVSIVVYKKILLIRLYNEKAIIPFCQAGVWCWRFAANCAKLKIPVLGSIPNCVPRR